jgi:hypothetical protein
MAAVVTLAVVTAAPAQAQIRVKVGLEPKVIGIDETATLTIEVQGGGLGGQRLRPGFQLENLEVMGGPSTLQNIRFENGAFAYSSQILVQLRPLTTGPAQIRALTLRIGDRVVRLDEQTIQVQEEPTGQADRDRREQEESQDPLERLLGGRMPWPDWRQEEQPAAFLRAEVEPKRPYVGQQTLYTVYLYTREDVTAVSAREIPTFRGFWVHDIRQPEHMPTELVEIEGERYSRVVLQQKALFPLRPGRHTVEPTEMDVLLRLYSRRLFGPPLTRSEQVALQTTAKLVDVQPLPPAPAGFGGAVGRVKLTASLQPETLRLGEAATLQVTLSGQGNLEGLASPEIAAPPGLTIYPPQQESMEAMPASGDARGSAGRTLRSKRTWSFVVVPERSGRFDLEPPRIPYFDPASRGYQVAAAPPLSMTAQPRADTAAGQGPGEPHDVRTASLEGGRPALWERQDLLPWLFALPWGLVLAVTLLRREKPSPAPPGGLLPGAPGGPSPRVRESSRAPQDRDSRRRCEEQLAAAASEARPRQAALGFEAAWRELLAERWKIPASVPLDRWPRAAEERGGDATTVDELRALVEDLQFLRQAPQLSATEAVRGEILDRSRRLLRRLK